MAGDADTFPLNAVAEERTSFPPTFIVSAECDVLYGEAKLMEEALSEAGTFVKHDAYEGKEATSSGVFHSRAGARPLSACGLETLYAKLENGD